MLRLFRRRRRRKSPPSFEPMNLSASNKTSVFFFSLVPLTVALYMCVWVNTGTLYSLTIPAEKKLLHTGNVFFFFSFLFGGFDWFLLRFTSSVPAFRRRRQTALHRAPFLVCTAKKKYIGRAAMGTVFIFKPCPVSNIYYASKAQKCKNNLSFFFAFMAITLK